MPNETKEIQNVDLAECMWPLLVGTTMTKDSYDLKTLPVKSDAYPQDIVWYPHRVEFHRGSEYDYAYMMYSSQKGTIIEGVFEEIRHAIFRFHSVDEARLAWKNESMKSKITGIYHGLHNFKRTLKTKHCAGDECVIYKGNERKVNEIDFCKIISKRE